MPYAKMGPPTCFVAANVAQLCFSEQLLSAQHMQEWGLSHASQQLLLQNCVTALL